MARVIGLDVWPDTILGVRMAAGGDRLRAAYRTLGRFVEGTFTELEGRS